MKQTREKTSKTIVARLRFIRTKIADLHKEEGVTLIELLAVVVVLGIIGIIAIPAVTNTISRSKESATLTTEATIQTALERYVSDHGQYPTTLGQLAQQTHGDGKSYPTPGDSSGGPYGPYLTTSFPQNDGWGNPIYYAPLPSSDTTASAAGATISGYVLLSGDGTAISLTNNATPSSTNGFVYAAGGTDAANVSIGYSPTLTTSQLPNYIAGPPVSGTGLYMDLYIAKTASTGTYTTLPTFTSK